MSAPYYCKSGATLINRVAADMCRLGCPLPAPPAACATGPAWSLPPTPTAYKEALVSGDTAVVTTMAEVAQRATTYQLPWLKVQGQVQDSLLEAVGAKFIWPARFVTDSARDKVRPTHVQFEKKFTTSAPTKGYQLSFYSWGACTVLIDETSFQGGYNRLAGGTIQLNPGDHVIRANVGPSDQYGLFALILGPAGAKATDFPGADAVVSDTTWDYREAA